MECLGRRTSSSSGTTIALDAFDITGYLEQASAPARIDDNNYAYLAYTPGIASKASTWAWSRWDKSGYWAASNDTYAYTDKKGHMVRFTFWGTAASWISCTSNTKGKAKVTLDRGTPGERTTTIDLYSYRTIWKNPVYTTGLLGAGTHTVEIECLREKRPASWWYTIAVTGST